MSTAVRARPLEVARLVWITSRPLSILVILLTVANAVTPALVVITLGAAVAEVPGVVAAGLDSQAGARLLEALALAAVVYGFSLVLAPAGGALSTAVSTRITGRLQGRLLRAVSGPVGIDHLEDPAVLDRLARADGSLTGNPPGDAPVTWAGMLASRLAGIIGCAVVASYQWWLGLLLLVVWFAVRRLMLRAVLRQSMELRNQTTTLRRAWYLAGVGMKARDAKEVRVFGLRDFFADRFQDEYRRTLDGGRAGLRRLHRNATIGFAVVIAAYAVALGTIAHQAFTGALDLRGLAILLPMLSVTMQTGSVSLDDITLAWSLQALPDVDALERELDPATARDGAGGAPAARTDPLATHAAPAATGVPEAGRAIRFEAVGFRYRGGERDILHGLDLTLTAGTSTAIVGVNGAGKSTLVGLLARLHDPSAGVIRVDGRDLRSIDAASWQRAVALMPQDPARFPLTAYENAAFGAIEHRDDRAGVEAAAELSGFAELVDHLPHGWDTVLSRALGGVDLSGGGWQRLALTRALFATRHGARILVLDEPTSALDIRSEDAFYRRFLEITRGLTTMVISHRFATVRRADRICVLDGGRITEQGTHDELVARDGTYSRMYRAQAERFGAAG